jgi:hypothetical protein
MDGAFIQNYDKYRQSTTAHFFLFRTTRSALNGHQVKLKNKRTHIYVYTHVVSYVVEISKRNDWFVLCCIHNIDRIVFCLFSWRYNPLWLYFHSPVAGFSLLVFEVS